MRRYALFLSAALLACCTSAPAPPPPTLPPPAPAAPQAPGATAVGTVYVTGSTVNVRREGSTSADILTQVKRGDRLALLSSGGDWMQVRLPDGTSGYVARSLVSTAPPSAKPRRGNCPPDSDFRFVTTPTPSFSQDGPHGLVVVEATVDTRGTVTATRIVSNDTGEPALAAMAEREIRTSKFAPPIRDCVPKAFIYTYKRTF